MEWNGIGWLCFGDTDSSWVWCVCVCVRKTHSLTHLPGILFLFCPYNLANDEPANDQSVAIGRSSFSVENGLALAANLSLCLSLDPHQLPSLTRNKSEGMREKGRVENNSVLVWAVERFGALLKALGWLESTFWGPYTFLARPISPSAERQLQ